MFSPERNPDRFPRADVDGSIAARFEKVAALIPQRTAVRCGADSLTYGALDRLANRIAHAILRRPCPSAVPIALLFKQNSRMIAASLAVLKAGYAFVQIDEAMPAAKLKEIFDTVSAKLRRFLISFSTNNRPQPQARCRSAIPWRAMKS